MTFFFLNIWFLGVFWVKFWEYILALMLDCLSRHFCDWMLILVWAFSKRCCNFRHGFVSGQRDIISNISEWRIKHVYIQFCRSEYHLVYIIHYYFVSIKKVTLCIKQTELNKNSSHCIYCKKKYFYLSFFYSFLYIHNIPWHSWETSPRL